MSCIKAIPGGIELSVRVVPRASRNEIAGLLEDALKIRLNAPPVDGKANKALVEFLADTLGAPARGITLVSGETGRTKRLRIAGLTPERAAAALGI